MRDAIITVLVILVVALIHEQRWQTRDIETLKRTVQQLQSRH